MIRAVLAWLVALAVSWCGGAMGWLLGLVGAGLEVVSLAARSAGVVEARVSVVVHVRVGGRARTRPTRDRLLRQAGTTSVHWVSTDTSLFHRARRVRGGSRHSGHDG